MHLVSTRQSSGRAPGPVRSEPSRKRPAHDMRGRQRRQRTGVDQDRSGRVKDEWHGSFHNFANPAHGSPACIPSDLIPGF